MKIHSFKYVQAMALIAKTRFKLSDSSKNVIPRNSNFIREQSNSNLTIYETNKI